MKLTMEMINCITSSVDIGDTIQNEQIKKVMFLILEDISNLYSMSFSYIEPGINYYRLNNLKYVSKGINVDND